MSRFRRAGTVAILSIACGLASHAQDATIRQANPDPARFESEIAAFEAWDSQNAFPRDGVLFVGSSSIRMWPTADSFPDLPVINRGFGGSHISDVNHYVDRVVLKYRPRVVVFYAGDNDIADGKSPKQVLGDFERFVATVHEQLPDARIVYLPIKPSLARWKFWPQMSATNALIQKLIEKHERLAYVDTATPMLDRDGQPRKELFLDDGLHLNAAGYQLWTEILHDRLVAP